ncbi:MAG: hypothetical protein II695_06085 [Oscillospiraceae bacterium]|nr:hypothetical protein [Oscillospiraceae bacterium]
MTGSAAAAAVSALTGMPCRIISGERQEHLDGGGICDIKAVIWAQGKDGAVIAGELAAAMSVCSTYSGGGILRIRAASPAVCTERDSSGYMRYGQEIEIIYEGEL